MSEAQRRPMTVGVKPANGYINGAAPLRSPSIVPQVDEFCRALSGKRPIHSILIANNGMAAVKFIRSIRTWAYETFVPGGTNNNNYANVQLIVEMAEITHVDAVWPGWGHASENPALPDALGAKGIVFLGPPAASMAALGDKIGSSLIAQAADVPTLPWSGSHVKIPPESCLVTIPDATYQEACVHTTEEAIASCRVVGYPAMIKASWGGGGKGIRKVHNDDEVKALFKQVQGEVPGSPIFIMKVASQSRHLEVQLLCDQYGNVAALHSRDCSVQRRHQKVEHPVTEWIAEINLPAAQVAVGMGIPLWQIPEIRRFYGMEHGGGYDAWRKTSIVATPFDFDKAESTKPKGHCVAVRVTSEDPDDGFKPTSGRVQELNFKSKPNVWAYFSVKSGGGIHEFSDSQFGHVFAFGESRALAIANMVLGLKEIQIRGEIRTNVDYTIDLLHALDYKENKIHTGWLDSRIAMRVRAERPPWYLSVVGGALYKASVSSANRVSEYVGYLEKGQIPPKHISLVNSQVSLNIEGSKYTINMVRGGPGSYRLRMNDSEIEAEIHTLRDGGLLMQLDGNSHVIYAEEEAAGTRLLIDGRTCLLQNDHDPSKLVAETPCKLLRYLVVDGSHVDADTPYAEVEVMKMCMPLLSPASGKIHFKMSEGQAMQAGELIARLDLDDPSAVRKAEPFDGSFPILGPPTAISGKVHQRCAASLNAARMILAGYEHNIDEVVQSLLSCLDNPELPFLQWQECFAVLAIDYPRNSEMREFEGIANMQNVDFPAKILRGVLEDHLNAYPEKEKGAQERLIEPLMSLVKSYERGREGHARIIVQGLFEEYLSVEELFSDNIQADVIERLRLQYKKDLLKIVDIVLSHQGIKSKNKLILRLLEQLVYPNPAAYRDQLIRFSTLNHTNYSESWKCFTEDGENMDTPKRKSAINERMEALVNAPLAVEDALVGLFDHSDHTLQRRLLRLMTAALREATHNLQAEIPDGSTRSATSGNMMHIALVGINNPMSLLQDSGDEDQAQERVNKLAKILKEKEVSSSLSNAGVGVVSCIIQRDEGRGPMRHSFHWSAAKLYYEEQPLLRHLEPPLSIYLELDKLKDYENIRYTPSRDRQWHLYTVKDKPLPIQRMFLRTLVRQPVSNEGLTVYQGLDHGETHSLWALSFTARSILRSLMSAMEEVELNAHNSTIKSDHAHMYLYILREQQIDDLLPYHKRLELPDGHEEAAVEKILYDLGHEINASVGVKMHRLGVCEWEVKLWISSEGDANGAWRVVVTNVTGHTCIVHVYREVENSSNEIVYSSISREAPLHGLLVNAQYRPLGVLEQKRLLARKSNTTYCYDFPLAFEAVLNKSWTQHPGINKPKDKPILRVTELVFADKKGSWGTPLVSIERQPALNDVGMVAWRMEMSTPEFPFGRTVFIVSNDVTFKNGSFGPREDAFFQAVTEVACAQKLPLIYLAANSGARIGVAEEVKSCFRVGWSDETNPERGFQYVYLTAEDYARIGTSVIAHELKLPSGETRWVIDTIVGKEDGLGVENLTGSGAIASAYSRAYNETFTVTYVTGRTVGIGAYLARLGMRCIQRLDQPIILTGFSALNKLLGREVYSSHMQLGGPKIMATNGVVHLTVSDDLEGISAILKWLSFVPAYSGGPLPILSPLDPPDRLVEYLPETSCDPRAAICGAMDGTGKWLGGMFDRDSFIETLEGWARTVVTGRAKLGGIPVGIVAVETQTMMQVIPADPGQLDSHERVVPQAGKYGFLIPRLRLLKR
ncbi:UNVERIFIED_CONTAM: Acetyl-CoA carboxylase 1 [Sesamum latifolium]|uniref:Acetyl-CoA carboxylase 1 n=1 Tax=Sesamum latifolium TaxID=2727402 RepID=A0AAW2WG51_9LAMI